MVNIRRDFALKPQVFCGFWVRESNQTGVKRLSVKTRERLLDGLGEVLEALSSAPSIKRVSDYWMALCRQMYPNLVSSAGCEPALHLGGRLSETT